MLTETELTMKIDAITGRNREILDRDLTTAAEVPKARIDRAIAIIRLNDLYEVLEKERPTFNCEHNTPKERLSGR